MQVVVSEERPDVDDQVRAAFRVRWPEFIFHDLVSNAHVERVGAYFGSWDLWLIDNERVWAAAGVRPCGGRHVERGEQLVFRRCTNEYS